jgi:hypothetical protein
VTSFFYSALFSVFIHVVQCTTASFLYCQGILHSLDMPHTSIHSSADDTFGLFLLWYYENHTMNRCKFLHKHVFSIPLGI